MTSRLTLGLRANLPQFALLVVVNGFVGALVGLERTVLPLIADQDFGLASRAAILSFLISFGVVKALANLFAGQLADRLGRKTILVAGWLVGLPVPFLIIAAPSWGWIVAANVLLGVNQGLCWSTTVIMKVDLVGPRQRGLAMGLNEFAGYVAVSASAFLTGYLAARYGLRPVPFYPGVGFALLGLLLSLVWVRDTRGHVRVEAQAAPSQASVPFSRVLLLTSWKEPSLFAASQAGLVNNLNDAVAWGLLPLLLAAQGLAVERVGIVAAVYPMVWGLGQLVTGALSDRWGRKWMIAAGMWVQAGGIVCFAVGETYLVWIAGAVVLGIGTAMVYPVLLAVIGDVAHPEWRASAIGVYRLWRDSGYAIGGLTAGLVADALNLSSAVLLVAVLTFVSGTLVAAVMRETRPHDSGALRSP